ncbi:MAG: XTP/dITP diphosphatase [Clostridia bacterium]|nr:XTP/dITP diphosphatase [Clostridia bacterium]
MKKLILATGNRNKVSEIRALLQDLPVEILTIEDYPSLVMPEEDQPTFAGNAAKKAQAVARHTGEISLADDSGLEVTALDGRPGVRSARYAGEDSNYTANNRLLLEELKNVPLKKRRACFKCVVAVAVPDDQTYITEESCPGRIAGSPQGEGGFGYDPLFIYEPAGVTFAEMTAEEKNKVSHRGRALHRTRELLERLLE